ncbi:Unknown protein sequence [Pseudomonas amygdali pv. sesami]|nr:Unknown protein sequence [Pseudomonas amygdali pv. sesami]
MSTIPTQRERQTFTDAGVLSSVNDKALDLKVAFLTFGN